MKGMVGGVKGTSIVAGMLVAAMGLGGCSQGSDTSAVQKDNAARVESDGTADQVQATFDISRNDEYGHVDIHVDGEQFHELGFDYGDSLDLIFSNGYEVRDIPYYTGFYSKIGEPLVLDYPGIEWLWASINLGDAFWDVAGLSEGDTVTVALNEKGKYEDVQNARNIEYTDNREDYASDAIFANYREVDADGIAPGTLYRSASPCDMRHNRASYVDKLAKESGIACAIDLADDLKSAEGHMADENFASDYFKELFDGGRVVLANMKPNYRAPEFHTTLVDALRQSMDLPTPWLVYCTEGKDRTGVVCMVLGALAGASYDQVEADYMASYANYYGITKESDPERYDVIVSELFHPMVAALFDETEVDVESVDLAQGAKSYLAKGGMKEEQIEELRGILTGAFTAGEATAG